jgi:hypothetical protein
MRLTARGSGNIFARLLIGTAESIPASELVDTTGCGDAFIGAVLHGEPLTSSRITIYFLHYVSLRRREFDINSY